jgi:threonine dehydrogenase-like Zn-dependent dehydrogenase
VGLWPSRAIRSAFLLGAEGVIAIDRLPERLNMAKQGRADIINYEASSVHDVLKEMTGGRGSDACLDAVGIEAHGAHGFIYAYDRVKQAVMVESDLPIALREAIMACRNGGIVSVIGVYGGLIDKFPMGSFMNRTMRTGQCHARPYWKGLLDRIERGESILVSSSPIVSNWARPRKAMIPSSIRKTTVSRWF